MKKKKDGKRDLVDQRSLSLWLSPSTTHTLKKNVFITRLSLLLLSSLHLLFHHLLLQLHHSSLVSLLFIHTFTHHFPFILLLTLTPTLFNAPPSTETLLVYNVSVCTCLMTICWNEFLPQSSLLFHRNETCWPTPPMFARWQKTRGHV
jgi:hypothetical protein